MAKSPALNWYGFTSIADDRCLSVLQSTRVHCYFAELIFHKFNECIPENVLII